MVMLDNDSVLQPASGKSPTSLVLFLHGYGANGKDLIGLAPILAKSMPETVFLSPDAPSSCPGVPQGRQWFPLTFRDPQEIDRGVEAAAPKLTAMIDDAKSRYALPASKIALVGFSQGTMMALHVAARYPEKLACVIGFSGLLARPAMLAAEAVHKPPVLLIHGEADTVVPAACTPMAQNALQQAGFEVDSLLVPGLGHGIEEQGLSAALQFLQTKLVDE